MCIRKCKYDSLSYFTISFLFVCFISWSVFKIRELLEETIKKKPTKYDTIYMAIFMTQNDTI